MTSICCASISHKNAPIRVLEAFTIEKPEASLLELRSRLGTGGCAIIQTCHRVEAYAAGEGIDTEILRAFLLQNSRGMTEAEHYVDAFEGIDALRHLFTVAAGAQSVILGENEILHQVMDSLRMAKDKGTLNDVLKIAFEGAIRVGRKVRRETQLSRGSVSIGNLVLKEIKDHYGQLEGLNIVVVGAGKMGCLVAKIIAKEKVRTVFVANRTYARARRLAKRVDGRAVKFDRVVDCLSEADAVICATASPHLILTMERVQDVLRRRGQGRKLLLIDISNPRSVDGNIKRLAGVQLLDIEDMTRISEGNRVAKESCLREVEEIVEEGIAATLARIGAAHTEPAISDIMHWAEGRRAEIFMEAQKAGGFNMQQLRVVESMSYSLMRDLLIPFIERARATGNAEYLDAIIQAKGGRC
jgi:glutamyl-tRNA reductase